MPSEVLAKIPTFVYLKHSSSPSTPSAGSCSTPLDGQLGPIVKPTTGTVPSIDYCRADGHGETWPEDAGCDGTHRAAEGKQEDEDHCSICLIEFSDGELCRHLPCGHTFHQTCVDPCLLRASTCPVCRKVLYRAARQRPRAGGRAAGSELEEQPSEATAFGEPSRQDQGPTRLAGSVTVVMSPDPTGRH